MWDKPHLLRMASGTLFGFSLVLALYGALHYVLHLPVFPLRAVQLSAAPHQVNTAQIEAVVRNEVHGNFFTVDLENTRRAFEKLPWVRKVSVRRHFPWRLDVSLEEHMALAHWNGAELVNTHGEVFAVECERVMPEALGTHRPPPCGETDQALPRFIGQPDTAAEVARMYTAFREQLAPLRLEIAQISLSPRRAWQLHLNSGMVLELGHEQPQQRMARFVAVYPYSMAPMQRTVSYVDLRYQNGFAAYLPGGVKAVKGNG